MNESSSRNQVIAVNLQHTNYRLVHQAVTQLGWKITSSEDKNLLFWCDSEGSVEFSRSLNRWQFVNHFPGMWSIAHKVELVRNYQKLSLSLPTIFDFFPRSFILPAQPYDIAKFVDNFSTKTVPTFIIKPDTGSQGRGIIITQNVQDLEDYSEPAVAQEYLSPFLLEGLKFDLRIYVLVTSVEPMRIYIYQEGMARFCTEEYAPPNPSNLEENYAHLTNFSLNKNNPCFHNPLTEDDINTGHKRSLTAVFHELHDLGVDTASVWAKIELIIRLTLLSAQPQLANYYKTAMNVNDGKSRCFEILGFDILLDSNQKPWLLEVNCMPSLSDSSPFDIRLKGDVIRDTLHIIDLQPDFREKCTERFLKRSMSKHQFVSLIDLPPLFDPNRESMLASHTDWKQLYPLSEKDLALSKICEMTLQHANLSFNNRNHNVNMKFSTFKPLDENGKISKSNTVPHELDKAKTKAIHTKPRVNSRRKQVVITPRKIEKPKTETIAKSLNIPKNGKKDLSKYPTVHQSISLGGRRTIISSSSRSNNNLISKSSSQPLTKAEVRAMPFEFDTIKPEFIDEAEEKVRIRNISNQISMRTSLNIDQKILIILDKLEALAHPSRSKTEDVHVHYVQPHFDL